VVQPDGGLFSPPEKRHAMTPVVRGAGKTVPVSKIAVTHVSPHASFDEHAMQH